MTTADFSQQPLWLPLARRHLGVKEIAGTDTHPTIAGFFETVGHPSIENDETPWCAAFVGAILENAGYDSSRSLLSRSYLDWGEPLTQAIPGAIAIFPRGADPAAGHVAFVLRVKGDKLEVIGGNQSDSVSIRSYDSNAPIGLRWPRLHGRWFETALAEVLRLEGGWSDHPSDPGGATNKGITHTTFQRAIGKRIIAKPAGDTISALRKISPADVEAIYHRLYWRAAACPLLPGPVALLHFDAAVNHGVTPAMRMLQTVVDAAADGEVGPETLTKVWACPQAELIEQYSAHRLGFYQKLKTWSIFGNGWRNRVAAITTAANAALKNYSTPDPSSQKDEKPMTTINPKQSKWWGESLTIWGAIVTALSTILPVLGPFIGIDVTAGMIQQFGETVTQLIQIIGGLTGTSMTLYGRSRADTRLTRRPLELRI